MPEIKVTTFNVEWMVNLFKTNKPDLLTRHNPRSPGLGGKPKDPRGVARRIAGVIRDVDPDILGICEGPPLHSQMATFTRELLDGDYEVFSMEDGQQSVHTLVHKRVRGLQVEQLPRTDRVFERLRQERALYKFGNVRKVYNARFTRFPVILRLKRKGKVTEIVTLHTKSKISDLRNAIDWRKRVSAKVISAIFSRQKLSIEMNAVRKYIAHRLYSERTDGVIVMGDLNDGITRDVVDENYLLHSIVHELRGAFHHEIALMRHVLSPRQLQQKGITWTAEFSDPQNNGKNTRVLLDHIVFSPRCYEGGTICFKRDSGIVEHEAFRRHVKGSGGKRDDRPSDHRPLSARFELM